MYAEKKIVSSPFYSFVEANGLTNDIDFAKMDFLQKMEIDYLFVERGNEFISKLNILPIEKIIDLGEFYLVKFDWP